MRGKSTVGNRMNHSQIYRIFDKVKKRAVQLVFSESKRIYPHMFRHNKAPQLTPKISASILEKQMGWTLEPEEVDITILETHCMKVDGRKTATRKSKICMICKTPNHGYSLYCQQCGRPLDFNEALILKQDEEKEISLLKDSKLLSGPEKLLFESLESEPELMREMIPVILKRIKSSGELKISES